MKRRSILKGIGAAGVAAVGFGAAATDGSFGDGGALVGFPDEGTVARPAAIEPVGDDAYRAEFDGLRDDVVVEGHCTLDCCHCSCPDDCPACRCGTFNCTC